MKDLFSFVKESENVDSNLDMDSFEVKLLFTNIRFIETIGPCVQKLYRNQTHIDSLSKSSFCRL